MTPTSNPRARARRQAAALLVVALTAMGSCGHRMDEADLIAANGGNAVESDVVEGREATVAPDGSTSPGATDPTTAVPGGTAGSPNPGAAVVDPTSGGSGAAAASAACSTPNQTGPIRVGSVGSYSGLAGSALVPFMRAVRVWVEHVNSEGGLCGRPVELIVVDDHTDPAQHLAALRDLVENREVVAMVGNASGTGDAGIRYMESTDVPVIGPTCNTPAVFESPSYFLACARFADHVRGIAANAAQFGNPSRNWGLFYCREDASCDEVKRGLIDQRGAVDAGLNVRYHGATSALQVDYTSECRAARSAGVDTLTVLLDAGGFQRFVQSCHRQGYHPTYVLSSSAGSYETKDFPGVAGGLVLTAPVFPFVGTDTAARQRFHDVMAAFYGTTPGPTEAQGWAAASLFERAATLAAQQGGSITPEALTDALHSMQGDTLDGLTIPLTFPAGRAGDYPPCWFVVVAQGGEWTSPSGVDALCTS